MESKKKILLFAGIIILVLGGIVLWLSSKQSSPPSTSPPPTKTLQDYGPIDDVQRTGPPDIRQEQLPDGRKIEYGSRAGKMTPEEEAELKKMIEEEKKKPQSDASLRLAPVQRRLVADYQTPAITAGFFFPSWIPSWQSILPHWNTYAASPEDALSIDMGTANPDQEQVIRNLFRAHVMYWTPQDLGKLTKIKLIADKAVINGAIGAWNYIKITNPDGSFSDIKGIMWAYQDGPLEVEVIHEYGHHYTNYWAAQRTNGAWENTNVWPIDSAGDYYALRPLVPGCSCASFDTDPLTQQPVCPYANRVWEILAEDYRATATIFNTGHYFAGATCKNGVGTVGNPDLVKTAAYLAALPLNNGAPPPANNYCIDSDHGRDYGSAGTLLTNAPNWQQTSTDQCMVQQGSTYAYQQSCTPPNCYLKEYFCTNTTPGFDDPPPACAGGCQNGACLGTGGGALPTITPKARSTPTPIVSNFPKKPFVDCYAKGGVCTQQNACLRFRGTVFQRDTTVCPISEGCCVFPHPQPIAPTQTPCETEGGVCTNQAASCTVQGGSIDGTKGCGGQCCKFPSLAQTYSNQDYEKIIAQVQAGTMSPLAVSAWIENACRTPGLQAISCDPNKDGDCDRLQCIR